MQNSNFWSSPIDQKFSFFSEKFVSTDKVEGVFYSLSNLGNFGAGSKKRSVKIGFLLLIKIHLFIFCIWYTVSNSFSFYSPHSMWIPFQQPQERNSVWGKKKISQILLSRRKKFPTTARLFLCKATSVGFLQTWSFQVLGVVSFKYWTLSLFFNQPAP